MVFICPVAVAVKVTEFALPVHVPEEKVPTFAVKDVAALPARTILLIFFPEATEKVKELPL